MTPGGCPLTDSATGASSAPLAATVRVMAPPAPCSTFSAGAAPVIDKVAAPTVSVTVALFVTAPLVPDRTMG